MTRIVIGTALSMALVATAACSGTSSTGPSSPSASPSTASPSTTAFSAQTFSTGPALTTLDHDHSRDGEGHGHEAELEGAIVSIDAAHKSFVVGSTTVNVLDTTVIRHGHTMLAFADLNGGDHVHVKGATNGAAIDAREIKVQNEGRRDDESNEAEGVVSGLTGTCPSITFTVGAKKVATNATTTFGRRTCAGLANGARVEVTGTVQSDGSILASRVVAGHEKDDGRDQNRLD